METAVLIPNYNGAKFMNTCMEALQRQTYRDFVVLVIDNGSTDGSAELLEKYEAQGKLRLILLPENTGFSGAVNAGIRSALSLPDKPEYIVLLNNDTEAEPTYLENMHRVMQADSGCSVAAVSPFMINNQDRSIIDSAGDGYCILGWAFQRGVGQNIAKTKFSRQTNVFSACAGAAMYRTAALEKIAHTGEGETWYFDPAHFAYLEDVDVSMRLRIHGYNILFEPSSRIYHVGSGTSGSRYNAFKVRLAARNNVYLNYKNMPFLMLLVNLIPILLGVLIKELFFIKMGFGKEYASGFFEGLRNLPSLRTHKLRFQPGRLGNYLKLELHMITDLFSYCGDFLARHI